MGAAAWDDCRKRNRGIRRGRSLLFSTLQGWRQSISYNPRLIATWAAVIFLLLYLLSGKGHIRHSQEFLQRNRTQNVAGTLAGKVAELNLGQYDSELLKLAVRHAVNPAEAASYLREIQIADSTGEFGSLMGKVQGIVWDLTHAEATVECIWDPTLHLGSLGKGRTGNAERYLVAANMHNNEEVLPHFILQLIHLFAVLPPETAFLSIYESGSTDSTGAWLEVLQNLLAAMHIPHRIVIGGSLTRAKDQARIDFLAQARNRALEPLWLNNSMATSTSLLLPHDIEIIDRKQIIWGLLSGRSKNKLIWLADRVVSLNDMYECAKITDRKLTAWGLPSGRSKSKPMWPADRVVFLNDVYFCARDTIRLLQHEGDMVCGLDFDRPKLEETPGEFQRNRFAEDMRRKWVPRWLGYQLSKIGPLFFRWRGSLEVNAAFKADSAMEFYDIWVARDSDGNMFEKKAPYVTDPYSLDRIAKGLPFPVKCCWNGMVILNAAPFLQHDARIRGHEKGECAASECTLLCNDFQRLGYNKFVLDPSVRLAYNHKDAQDVHKAQFVRGVRMTDWADVQSSPGIDWSLTPHRPYSKCCGLPEGHDMIEFDKDCKWDNFMTPNFTAVSLRARMQKARSIEAIMPQQQLTEQAALNEEWTTLREDRLLSARNGS